MAKKQRTKSKRSQDSIAAVASTHHEGRLEKRIAHAVVQVAKRRAQLKEASAALATLQKRAPAAASQKSSTTTTPAASSKVGAPAKEVARKTVATRKPATRKTPTSTNGGSSIPRTTAAPSSEGSGATA